MRRRWGVGGGGGGRATSFSRCGPTRWAPVRGRASSREFFPFQSFSTRIGTRTRKMGSFASCCCYCVWTLFSRFSGQSSAKISNFHFWDKRVENQVRLSSKPQTQTTTIYIDAHTTSLYTRHSSYRAKIHSLCAIDGHLPLFWGEEKINIVVQLQRWAIVVFLLQSLCSCCHKFLRPTRAPLFSHSLFLARSDGKRKIFLNVSLDGRNVLPSHTVTFTKTDTIENACFFLSLRESILSTIGEEKKKTFPLADHTAGNSRVHLNKIMKATKAKKYAAVVYMNVIVRPVVGLKKMHDEIYNVADQRAVHISVAPH